MKVINLFAGPGAGKSTMAAGIFHKLKLAGKNVELVTEFAKQLTWAKRQNELENQVYIFAKQYHKMWIVKDQVDYIITDSPLPLGLVYCPDDVPLSFGNLVLDIFDQFDNENFFIRRGEREYNSKGRNQSLEESQDIDKKIINTLVKNDIDFLSVDISNSVESILRNIGEYDE